MNLVIPNRYYSSSLGVSDSSSIASFVKEILNVVVLFVSNDPPEYL